MGFFQVRILEWVAMPSSRDLPNPGIKPRSPTLQAGSLPSEPSGKPPFVSLLGFICTFGIALFIWPSNTDGYSLYLWAVDLFIEALSTCLSFLPLSLSCVQSSPLYIITFPRSQGKWYPQAHNLPWPKLRALDTDVCRRTGHWPYSVLFSCLSDF